MPKDDDKGPGEGPNKGTDKGADKNAGKPGENGDEPGNVGGGTTRALTLDEGGSLTLEMATAYEAGDTGRVLPIGEGARTEMLPVFEEISAEYALGLPEAAQLRVLPQEDAQSAGATYVSRAMLEAVMRRAMEAEKKPSLETPVLFQGEAVYTSIDIVGSTNAQSVFFDQRCPAELRTKFIRLQGSIIDSVTTIVENFHGSADGFQGDEITATFPDPIHAYMASHSIRICLKRRLEELRGLIEEFNTSHASGGGTYEVKAGLRIVHTSAEGLLLMNNPEITGTITRGPAIGRSKAMEADAKAAETDMNPNTTNIFVDTNKRSVLEEASTLLEVRRDQYTNSGLRLGEGVEITELAGLIRAGTKLPTNEAASKHPNSTLAVPLCIYLPDVTDETGIDEFQRLIGVIGRTLREYQCEDIKAVAGGNGLFTTFENGDTEELATKALQAVRRAIDEFNAQNFSEHRFVCAIGKKDRVVRFRAGSERRHELTRIGSVINELFRGLAVAIDMYHEKPEGSRESLAVTLTAPERIKEYCEVIDTSRHWVKGVSRELLVTELGKVISKRRAVMVKGRPEIELIGEGAKSTVIRINEIFDSTEGTAIIKIRGISPSIELIARKTLERSDTCSLCLVRPEGQDALKEYQTIFQIIFELINEYGASGVIAAEDQNVIAGHLRTQSETSIEKALRHCIDCISANTGCVMQICVLEAESMDESSKFVLESAVQNSKGKARLIIAGANIDNPDINEEDTETVSPEEAKELVKLILERRAGKMQGPPITEDDLSRIVGSFPKDGNGRVRGAYVLPWVSELIANGDLYQGAEIAWEANQNINQESYRKNTILTRKLNALEAMTPGITEVAYAVAAAGRPVKPEELAVATGTRTEAMAKLAAQGILLKVDVGEGGETDLEPQIGKTGYIIAPIYREAIEACLEGWGDRRMEVHEKIIKDSSQDVKTLEFKKSGREAADRARKKNLKELRGVFLMHYREYFKYFSAEELDKASCEWLKNYMEVMMVDAKEELDVVNRSKVARRLPVIYELQTILSKCPADGASDEMATAKRTYMELVSMLSGSASMTRINTGDLMRIAKSDSFEQKLVNELCETNPLAAQDLRVISALLQMRGRLMEAESLKTDIPNAVEEVIRIVEAAKSALPEEPREDAPIQTRLRFVDALETLGLVIFTAVERGLSKLPEAGNEELASKLLEEATNLGLQAIKMGKEFNIGIMSESQKRAAGKVLGKAESLVYFYVPGQYAERNGLSCADMVTWHKAGAHTLEGKPGMEMSIIGSVTILIRHILGNGSSVSVDNIAHPLEADRYLRLISAKVAASIQEKRRARASGDEWVRPQGMLHALGNYTSSARRLARAYLKYTGEEVDGVERRQAAINLLIKAKKAAALTRELVGYEDDPEGAFLFEHGLVYNTAEACVELAFLGADGAEQNQMDFNAAMADLAKLRTVHGDSYKGRPIAEDISRLSEWAALAGLDFSIG